MLTLFNSLHGPCENLNQIDKNLSYACDDNKVTLLLYGDSRFDDNENNVILSASVTYISETKIFSTSPFQSDAWILILP